MYLQTATPKTAELFIGRLRETEKITIRAASSDARLEYLLRAEFASDMITLDVLKEAARLLHEESKIASAGKTFGLTWKI
jgi:hypothetical protein